MTWFLGPSHRNISHICTLWAWDVCKLLQETSSWIPKQVQFFRVHGSWCPKSHENESELGFSLSGLVDEYFNLLGFYNKKNINWLASKQQKFMFHCSGGWVLRSGCQCGWVLVRTLFLAIHSWLTSFHSGRWSRGSRLSSHPYKGTDPIPVGLTLMTSLNPNHMPGALPPVTITCEVGF